MKVSVQQLRIETNQPEKPVKKITPIKNIAAEESIAARVPEKKLIKEITKDNILGAGTNLEKRKEMIAAKGFEPANFAYERAIGQNDSLYSNFIELMALTKRKVGRIVIKQGQKQVGYATGFMVSPSLLLTNWHVFNDAEMARDSEVHFFYEYDTRGVPQPPVVFRLDATVFFSNEDLDYCFVGVQPMDDTGQVALSAIGYLYLDKGLGKIGDVNVEKLNIIHHPRGDYKQISIRANTFVDINETKIFYETDTAQGSSGSPVFNDQWQVVGLHHKSIAKMTADEKNYLDKDGNIIPEIAGTIDLARIVWLKNEGMRISVILNHLAEKNPGNAVVAAIGNAPPPEKLQFTLNQAATAIENNSTTTTMTTSSNNDIRISVPISALSEETAIEISLSAKKKNGTVAVAVADAKPAASSRMEELLLEVAKIDKEAAVDFSRCKGYDPDFLGVPIPLPQPQASMTKYLALLKDKTKELKYFKYSVIFNAAARMPFISAVNVEGAASKRKDNSKRSDDWLRDNRIDTECQLFDKFYAYSQLDKGHMSRFEDANWDASEASALRNGVYTCMYTNACPQVVALNRGGGLWGKLEKQVLEKGVKKESGRLARMSVFNGPIFDPKKDKLFKAVTIPMQFYKIICWLNDAQELKATAFKLSQETLVGHIDFDEAMRIDDQEAIDIDQVVAFKEYQCTIKSLSKLTKINFDHLIKYDTYKAGAHADETLLLSEEEVML